MTHAEWNTSNNPAAMLQWLTSGVRMVDGEQTGDAPRKPSARQLRLFACACCRAVWDRLTDPRSRRAVEVAELHADGLATDAERFAAQGSTAPACGWGKGWSAENGPARLAAWGSFREPDIVADTLTDKRYGQLVIPGHTQAAILRSIIGDPFRPEPFNPRWLTPDVLAIASRIYAARDWDAMPMLADALETAGCADVRVLEWLRGRERCGSCEVEVGSQRMQVSGIFIQLDGDWGFPKNPKQTPAYLPQCKHCHGGGWRPMRQPVRCRGDWVIDLVLGRE